MELGKRSQYERIAHLRRQVCELDEGFIHQRGPGSLAELDCAAVRIHGIGVDEQSFVRPRGMNSYLRGIRKGAMELGKHGYGQRHAIAPHASGKVNQFGRAVADEDTLRIHIPLVCQCRLQSISVRIGIMNNPIERIHNGLAHTWSRPQRIDTGAEIENVAPVASEFGELPQRYVRRALQAYRKPRDHQQA